MYNILVLLSILFYFPIRTIAMAIGLCVLFTELFDTIRGQKKDRGITARIVIMLCFIAYVVLAFVFADYTASLTNGIFANFP